MLGLSDVTPYLLERELLDRREVVEGGLRIADVSRRNSVFLVTTESRRCLVLKVAGADDAGVAREAAVLRRLHEVEAAAALRAFLPVPIAYDEIEGVLVTEAVRGAQDLARMHATRRFPRLVAATIGRALALVHELAGEVVSDLELTTDVRWTLSVHRLDLDQLRKLSGAAVDLVRVVQHDEVLCQALDALHASWEDRSLIHGDVRWDNVLAFAPTVSGRRTRPLLIDWELASAGDPAADIGAFLGEYLRAWLRSIPVADPMDPARLFEHATVPLARIRAPVAAFWGTYAQTATRPPVELNRMLRRATQFAAVRALEGAFEEAQTRATLHPRILYQQQLSLNILRRPDEAAAHLLGFVAPWDRT